MASGSDKSEMPWEFKGLHRTGCAEPEESCGRGDLMGAQTKGRDHGEAPLGAGSGDKESRFLSRNLGAVDS